MRTTFPTAHPCSSSSRLGKQAVSILLIALLVGVEPLSAFPRGAAPPVAMPLHFALSAETRVAPTAVSSAGVESPVPVRSVNPVNPGGSALQRHLQLWLAAEDIQLADGGKVSVWPDRSGRGFDAVQTNAVQQPAFVAAGLGGKPAVQLDGSDDSLLIADRPNLSLGPQQSIFIVAQMLATTQDDVRVFGKGISSIRNYGLWLRGGDGAPYSQYYFGDNHGLSDARSDSAAGSAPHLYSVSVGSSGHKLYQDGRQVGSALNVGTPNILDAPVAIGSMPGYSYYFNGKVAEIVVFDTSFTEAKRQGMECYLSAKYGIPLQGISCGVPSSNAQEIPGPVAVLPTGVTLGETPDPVGMLQGQFTVTSGGAASYHIPLPVPPGINGMEPQLSLDYVSQGPRNGQLGTKWSLGGLSTIQRCGKTIATDGEQTGICRPRLQACGEIPYCLDGERLIKVDATNSFYSTETDRGIRAQAQGSCGDGPCSFEVKYQNGTIAEYGSTPDSRIEGVGTGPDVRVWALGKMRDRNGNFVQYKYAEDGAGKAMDVIPSSAACSEDSNGAFNNLDQDDSLLVSKAFFDQLGEQDIVLYYLHDGTPKGSAVFTKSGKDRSCPLYRITLSRGLFPGNIGNASGGVLARGGTTVVGTVPTTDSGCLNYNKSFDNSKMTDKLVLVPSSWDTLGAQVPLYYTHNGRRSVIEPGSYLPKTGGRPCAPRDFRAIDIKPGQGANPGNVGNAEGDTLSRGTPSGSGNYRLDQILYTGNSASSPALSPQRRVKFEYADRSDPEVLYQNGFRIEETKLLKSIRISIDATPDDPNWDDHGYRVQEYRLGYRKVVSRGSRRSLLERVEVCDGGTASDWSGQSCLPPITFGWEDSDDEILLENWSAANRISSQSADLQSRWRFSFIPGDFNGDGLTDLVAWPAETGQRTDCGDHISLYIATGNGAYARQGCAGTDHISARTQDYHAGYNSAPTEFSVGDFNGDGRDDLLQRYKGTAQGSCLQNDARWFLSQTDNQGQVVFSPPTCLGFDGGGAGADAASLTAVDFNGDGFDDILYHQDNDSGTYNGCQQANQPIVYITDRSTNRVRDESSTAAGSQGICLPPFDPDYGLIHVADVNADGRGDLIYRPYANLNGNVGSPGLCGTGNPGGVAALLSSTKVDSMFTYDPQPKCWGFAASGDPDTNATTHDSTQLVLGDFNGDGVMDVLLKGMIADTERREGPGPAAPPDVGCGITGDLGQGFKDTKPRLYLSLGDGTVDAGTCHPELAATDKDQEYSLIAVDANGDGRTDLIRAPSSCLNGREQICNGHLNRPDQDAFGKGVIYYTRPAKSGDAVSFEPADFKFKSQQADDNPPQNVRDRFYCPVLSSGTPGAGECNGGPNRFILTPVEADGNGTVDFVVQTRRHTPEPQPHPAAILRTFAREGLDRIIAIDAGVSFSTISYQTLRENGGFASTSAGAAATSMARLSPDPVYSSTDNASRVAAHKHQVSGGLSVVGSFTQDGSVEKYSSDQVLTYRYRDGKVDLDGRGFLGFGTVAKIDGADPVGTPASAKTTITRYHQSYPLSGALLEVVLCRQAALTGVCPEGDIRGRTSYSYTPTVPRAYVGLKVYPQIRIAQEKAVQYEFAAPPGSGATAPALATFKDYQYDSFGNQTLLKESQSSLLGPPALPSTHLRLWLTADEIQQADGSAVAVWHDLSGNLNHAAQQQAGKQPHLQLNGIHGRPALIFDGADDSLLVPGAQLNFTRDFTIFAVVDVDFRGPAGFRGIVTKPSSSANLSGQYGLILGNGIRAQVLYNGSTPAMSGSLTADSHVIGASVGSDLVEKAFADGRDGKPITASQATNAESEPVHPVHIGEWGSLRFKGKIAEILIYDASLADQERKDANCHLARKYGIPPYGNYCDGVGDPPPLYTCTEYYNQGGDISNGNWRNFGFRRSRKISTDETSCKTFPDASWVDNFDAGLGDVSLEAYEYHETNGTKSDLKIEKAWDETNKQWNQRTVTEYDAYGHAVKVLDEQGIITQTFYDSTYHTFPVSQVVDPNNEKLSSSAEYDVRNGERVVARDVNGNLEITCLDAFGRQVATQTSHPLWYSGADAPCVNDVAMNGGISGFLAGEGTDALVGNRKVVLRSVRHVVALQSQGRGTSTTTYTRPQLNLASSNGVAWSDVGKWPRNVEDQDGLGRGYRSESYRNPLDVNDFLIQETVYDTRGLVSRSSASYKSGAGEGDKLWTRIIRDAFERPIYHRGPLLDAGGSNSCTDGPLGMDAPAADNRDLWNRCRTTKTAYDFSGLARTTWSSYQFVDGTDPGNNGSDGHGDLYDSKSTEIFNARMELIQRADFQDDDANPGRIAHATTSLTHAPTGETLSVTDPKGVIDRIAYDSLGRKQTHQRGDGGTISYAYCTGTDGCPTGLLLSTTDASGQKVVRTYDRLGRPTRVTYIEQDGSTTESTAETSYLTKAPHIGLAGSQVRKDSQGTEIARKHFDYTRGGEVKQWTFSSNVDGSVTPKTYTFGGDLFDTHSDHVTAYLPDQSAISLSKDAQGRVVRHEINRGNLLTVTYDIDHDLLPKTLTYGNGVKSTYGYDELRRPISLVLAKANGTELVHDEYSYDQQTGLLTSIADRRASPAVNTSQTFTYRNRRLATASSPETYAQITYQYDAGGFMTKKTSSDSHATKTLVFASVANSNKVQTLTKDGASIQFVYDGNGDLTEQVQPGVIRDYDYDAAGRLVVLTTNDYNYSFVYGFEEGERIRKIANYPSGYIKSETHYVTGGYVVEFQRNDDSTNSIIPGTVKYSRHVGSAVLTQPGFGDDSTYWDSDGNGKDAPALYMHPNQVNSTALVTDSQGNEVKRIQYEPYGGMQSVTGTGDVPRYTFGQKEEDGGLYFFSARYYDPETGRFISADTHADLSRDGLNLYAYAANNPVMNTDPTGHFVVALLVFSALVITGALIAAGTEAAAQRAAFGEIRKPSRVWAAALNGAVFGGVSFFVGGAAGAAAGAALGWFAENTALSFVGDGFAKPGDPSLWIDLAVGVVTSAALGGLLEGGFRNNYGIRPAMSRARWAFAREFRPLRERLPEGSGWPEARADYGIAVRHNTRWQNPLRSALMDRLRPAELTPAGPHLPVRLDQPPALAGASAFGFREAIEIGDAEAYTDFFWSGLLGKAAFVLETGGPGVVKWLGYKTYDKQ